MKKQKNIQKNNSWRFFTQNQKEVAAKIAEGNYDLICGTGWGFLDELFVFLFELGYFKGFDFKSEGYQRIMIPMAKLLLLYELKALLGVESMNQTPELLFKDVALLKIIGFTAQEIKEGFSKRGDGKHIGPMHQDTLADCINRLSPAEVENLLNASIKLLINKKFLGSSTFILDASDLETTEKYENCGSVTRKEKKVDKKGQIHEIEVTVYGWKVLVLYEHKSHIIVAVKVVHINEHESKYTLELVEKAKENLGEKAKMKLLLIDRGFLDGETLWKLKFTEKIDFIIPSKSNMAITTDVRDLLKISDSASHFSSGELEVFGISGVNTWDCYTSEENYKCKNRKDFKPSKLNVAAVRHFDKMNYSAGEEKIFLTSLPVKNPEKIIEHYKNRFSIEISVFRESKQGWCLKKFPMKTENAVINHVMLTFIMFNGVNAFRSKRGQKFANSGIKRWRLKHARSIHQVVVFAGDYYGIFDIEEVMMLCRHPPNTLMRAEPKFEG